MNVTLVSTMSILGIAALVWTVNRLSKTLWCPICVGVAGTWLWMIVARYAGVSIDPTMLAILLGGSVAGTAYLLEKHLPQDRSKLLWKTLFIPIGFIASLYGMNFDPAISPWNMPELHWRYGYPFALGLMAGSAALLIYILWRKGWI